MTRIDWRTEQRKLSDLMPWDKNPRQLTNKQAEDITESLRKFGIVEPPAINLDNTIIGGHQRKRLLSMMQEYGPESTVDVRVPSRALTDREVEELNIRLNKNTGGWDFDVLANEFEIEDLLEWGFEPNEFGIDGLDDFDPVDESEQPRLDQKKPITCPHCGEEFTPA